LEIEAYNQIPTATKRLVVIAARRTGTLYSDRSLLGERQPPPASLVFATPAGHDRIPAARDLA